MNRCILLICFIAAWHQHICGAELRSYIESCWSSCSSSLPSKEECKDLLKEHADLIGFAIAYGAAPHSVDETYFLPKLMLFSCAAASNIYESYRTKNKAKRFQAMHYRLFSAIFAANTVSLITPMNAHIAMGLRNALLNADAVLYLYQYVLYAREQYDISKTLWQKNELPTQSTETEPPPNEISSEEITKKPNKQSKKSGGRRRSRLKEQDSLRTELQDLDKDYHRLRAEKTENAHQLFHHAGYFLWNGACYTEPPAFEDYIENPYSEWSNENLRMAIASRKEEIVVLEQINEQDDELQEEYDSYIKNILHALQNKAYSENDQATQKLLEDLIDNFGSNKLKLSDMFEKKIQHILDVIPFFDKSYVRPHKFPIGDDEVRKALIECCSALVEADDADRR